jgi:hypothetical protein
LGKTRCPVGQVQVEHWPAAPGEGLPVSGRLGGLQRSEGVRLTGHREINGDRPGDL